MVSILFHQFTYYANMVMSSHILSLNHDIFFSFFFSFFFVLCLNGIVLFFRVHSIKLYLIQKKNFFSKLRLTNFFFNFNFFFGSTRFIAYVNTLLLIRM